MGNGYEGGAVVNQAQQRAYDAGKQAFKDQKERMPEGYRNAPSLAKAWEEGWQAGEQATRVPPKIRVQEPVVRTQVSPDRVRKLQEPCPNCGRTVLSDGLSRAVVVSHQGVLQCRGCGVRFHG